MSNARLSGTDGPDPRNVRDWDNTAPTLLQNNYCDRLNDDC